MKDSSKLSAILDLLKDHKKKQNKWKKEEKDDARPRERERDSTKYT